MSLSREKMDEVTKLADGVTEIVHKVATRRLVQTIEFIHEDQIQPLRETLREAKHHIQSCLLLNEDNRLMLAVQGRSMVRKIEAHLDGVD